ncbi:MAG: ornithine cyclodeaminase family protein [Proteobacteria bacterium]|nr:ornithine cyclodeaminase family protein [Pseudomonadota bacterium]
MRIISNKEVAYLLSMPKAIEIIADVMPKASAGKVNLPLRHAIEVGGPNLMGIMPGSLGDPACYGVKLLSLFPGNAAVGHSSHRGAMVLFEAEYGAAIALMDAAVLSAVRTAAASAVATNYLARTESSILTLIGYGEQAETHLDAMTEVRPITEVRIAGRNAEKAQKFADESQRKYPNLAFTTGTDIRKAAQGADIICTITGATEPLLFGDWINDGTHLNIVGSSIPSKREIDEDLVAKASFYVDYRPSTFAQAGEVMSALESGRITKDHIRSEIGELDRVAAGSRKSENEITLYRSLGIAAQDLACAHFILRQAEKADFGVTVEF